MSLCVKRSPPSINRLQLIHLHQFRPFSTSPPPLPPSFIVSSFETNSHENPSTFRSFLRLVSGIALGSSVGLVGYLSSSEKSFMAFADWSTAATAEVSVDDHQTSNPKFLIGDALRRKIFFNYEKRIRMRSPPEKEYIFFVTLLSIPESSFSVAFKMFDIDCNGEIDREKFKRVMALMRAHNRQGAIHRDGLRAGLRVGCSVENGGLVEYFFGKDGKKCLQHEKFVQFLRSLHAEMVRLEFAHYDYKLHGTISAKDFALSMVASADMRHLNKLLDRVEELNKESNLSNVRITEEEFKDFAELRKRLLPFSLALFSYGKVNGLLTMKDFQRAASQVCGVSLTDNVVEIIFHVFDANCDGSLSADEFIRVLQKRERDIAQPSEAGFMNSLSCWWMRLKNVLTDKLNSLRQKQASLDFVSPLDNH
ncbi:unnamed protein product [Camellia sinensis]